MAWQESYDTLAIRHQICLAEATALESDMNLAQFLTLCGTDTDALLRGAVANCDVSTTKRMLEVGSLGPLTERLRSLDRASMLVVSIRGFGGHHGTFSYNYVRIVRLLMDSGADIHRRVRGVTPNFVELCHESALDAVVKLKAPMTGGNLRKMEFLHHALLREEAVHAVSWLWPPETSPALAPAAVPAVPAESAVPAVPAESAVPAVPAESAVPAVPAESAAPAVPAESAVPAVPAAPAPHTMALLPVKRIRPATTRAVLGALFR
ncbi:unnamed protein product [Ectocarpus sp. 6 AP-2014]